MLYIIYSSKQPDEVYTCYVHFADEVDVYGD